jgi:hypothetical protein
VEPSDGPLDGGTLVTVAGTAFVFGQTTITFGGSPAEEVEVHDPSSLTCLTPAAGVAGPVPLDVTTPQGTATLPDAFTYLAQATTPTLPRPSLPAPADEPGSLDRLLGVQQAVVTFCQARADVVGILSLPGHFEQRDCSFWLGAFRERLGLPRQATFPDEARELADLSYVAAYHPWLLVPDQDAPGRVRSVPPDGAICGAIATRELERGVWVAPANTPLRGALGVLPALSTDDWATLFDLGFNVIRQEPRDVRAMSAHTLSGVRSLLQVSVRRLLILLRKLAVERGMDFVFESNHEVFREGVRATLNDLLRTLGERGAFVSAQPGIGFRVVTDASVNPPQEVERGRFVAEIGVAPSQPAEFITVLLTRTGEGLLQVGEA